MTLAIVPTHHVVSKFSSCGVSNPHPLTLKQWWYPLRSTPKGSQPFQTSFLPDPFQHIRKRIIASGVVYFQCYHYIGFQLSPDRTQVPSTLPKGLFFHNYANFLGIFLWTKFFGKFFRVWILKLFLHTLEFQSIYSCSTPIPSEGVYIGGMIGVDTPVGVYGWQDYSCPAFIVRKYLY